MHPYTLSLLRSLLSLQADLRDNYNPGWKYNHWELKVIIITIINFFFKIEFMIFLIIKSNKI